MADCAISGTIKCLNSGYFPLEKCIDTKQRLGSMYDCCTRIYRLLFIFINIIVIIILCNTVE